MAISKERQQQHQREARALLEGFWPDVFRFSQPRPLKLGIFAERRGLPFDAMILKAAIKAYVCRYTYQRAMCTITERIGLDGQPDGEVSPEQQAYSRRQIRRIDAKAKEKARKRATEAENAAKSPGSQSGA